MTSDLRRPRIAFAIALVVLAGCGGSGGGTQPSPTGAAQPSPTGAAATSGPTQAPTSSPVSTPAPSPAGGGGTADACALMTADEAAGIFGATGVTTELLAGEPSYCFWREGTDDLAASSYTKTGGAALFEMWKSASGVIAVPGLGDGAVFDPSTATLFILKGETVVGITAGQGGTPQDQRLAWAKQIAQLAVGRM